MNNMLICLVLAVCLHTASAAADNPEFVLAFGGEPGAPLAYGYDYGAPDGDGPVYRLRIPTIHESIRAVFYDVELTVTRDPRIVQRVRAERAYRADGSCPEARDVIAEKLAALLPREYRGGDGRWQYQSADGTVVGRAVCTRPRRFPFPVLELDIALASDG